MKVKDLMTTDVKSCTPDTTVAEAAHLMWEGDCGMLPVVDEGGLVGVVTDRDMYIALATQDARASQLKVGAVARNELRATARGERVDVGRHEPAVEIKGATMTALQVMAVACGWRAQCVVDM